MDNQKKWQNIRSQLDKATKDLVPKNKFAINDKIMTEAQRIMTKQSLSLIYDEYGNQIYEKNSDIQNYMTCKKTGSTFLLVQDESKLVETKTRNDEFNTDFISYDSLENINKNDVKFNMNIDESMGFEKANDYLYLKQEKDKRKEEVISQGIDKIKKYINEDGRKELNKIDSNFISVIE